MLLAGMAVSCYDDSAVMEKISDLDDRISALFTIRIKVEPESAAEELLRLERDCFKPSTSGKISRRSMAKWLSFSAVICG